MLASDIPSTNKSLPFFILGDLTVFCVFSSGNFQSYILHLLRLINLPVSSCSAPSFSFPLCAHACSESGVVIIYDTANPPACSDIFMTRGHIPKHNVKGLNGCGRKLFSYHICVSLIF